MVLSISSGQRQLISIARALATDPELIIFDGATSYIDSETEKKIQNALFNLTRPLRHHHRPPVEYRPDRGQHQLAASWKNHRDRLPFGLDG
ncbi:MAG: ATP-binding cassette domain-containing protein [Desulfobacterales bacterium]|nr:ATP-binding cassette domain-containing protein [Desulfobacterales bacterium]